MSKFQGKGPDLNPFVGLKDLEIDVGGLVSVLLILKEHGLKLRDMPELLNKKIAGVDFNGSEDIDIPFSGLANIPTTLSGYGITDSITIEELIVLLNGKTSLEDGKGLSENSYTTIEKNKLAGISTQATANGTVTGSGTTSGINTGDETLETIKSKLLITTLSGANTGDQTTITGNAGTATKLQTARTISISGDATGTISFDGTENKNIVLSIADDSHNHIISNIDGLDTALSLKADKTQILTDVPANAIFTDTVYNDAVLTAKVTIEKNRIDAILAGAEADKDSFAEIVALINTVDTENDSTFAGYVTSNNNRSTLIEEGKVDKVAGKELSTNDYTTLEKNKLTGIEINANNYTLPTTVIHESELSNSVSSTSTTTAANSAAVKSAYDLANSKTNNTGTVTSVSTTGAITGGPFTAAGTISHSTADGYLHVPATSTTNNGKVLMAGATAGSFTWTAIEITDTTYLPGSGLSLIGTTFTNTAQNVSTNLSLGERNSLTLDINSSDGTNATIPNASITLSGVMSATDKIKLDNIEVGANNYILPASVIHESELSNSVISPLTTVAASSAAVKSVYDLANSKTSNLGTVTSVSTNGDIVGGPFTTSGTISHKVADGSLHVPVTGTTNAGKVLTAGATAGSFTWEEASPGFLDPMTTRGDIIFRNSGNVTNRLGAGTAGQILTSDGTDIAWVNPAVSGIGKFINSSIAISNGNTALTTLNPTSNRDNVAIGENAGKNITTGIRNMAFGVDSMLGGLTGLTGSSNIAMLYQSGFQISSGNYNTLVGYQAGRSITTGSHNLANGYGALFGDSVAKTTGSYNIGIGYNAGYTLSTGETNVFIGKFAGLNVTSGDNNVGIGQTALGGNYTSKMTGSNNIGIGHQAGYNLTTGQYNILAGYQAGFGITAASSCVAIGYQANYGEIHLNGYNVAIGDSALKAGGQYNYWNVAIGKDAGATSTGSSNVFIGYSAGSLATSGANNICIGREAQKSSVGAANEATIGNTSITKFRVPGIKLEMDATGFTISSPDGSLFKVSIDNDGSLITTKVV